MNGWKGERAGQSCYSSADVVVVVVVVAIFSITLTFSHRWLAANHNPPGCREPRGGELSLGPGDGRGQQRCGGVTLMCAASWFPLVPCVRPVGVRWWGRG